MVAGFALTQGRAEAQDLLCRADLEAHVPDGAPGAEPSSEAAPARWAAAGPMCTFTPAPTPPEAPVEGSDATDALHRARQLAADGQPARAILALRLAADAEPAIADRFLLEEAELRMAAGPDSDACDAFEEARESEHRDVAARARIGHVRCLLTIGDREGVEELETLRRRFAELPQAGELRFLLGRAHEGWGETADAGRVYRDLDLMLPGSGWARRARERVAALRSEGVAIRELTLPQQVDRAERLVRTGPIPAARDELHRLSGVELPRPLAQQVARSAARIARAEGRFETAARLLRVATGMPDLEAEEREALERRQRQMADAAESVDSDDARRRVRAMMRGRAMGAQPTARAFAILRLAARGGLTDTVDDVLRSLRGRDRMPPGLLFDAGLLSAGVGSDALVAATFASAARHPSLGVAAHYHRARTLERMGEEDGARREYRHVIESDSERLPFYALWARQRLRVMTPPAEPVTEVGHATSPALGAPLQVMACTDGPFTLLPDNAAGKVGDAEQADVSCTLDRPDNPYAETAPPAEAQPEAEAVPDPLAEADGAATEIELRAVTPAPDYALSDEAIEALLTSLSEAHGEAFPWLNRARALFALGEREAASEELHEVYTAWRDANGRGSLRAGVEGVMRGAAPPRHRVSGATWRARRTFPSDARRDLARVCAAIGDHGLAIRLGGFDVAGPRPHAYEAIVEAAAARHGVEPDLLFAVMRVESVYNPRIISYAGAIGLMQIMPRTGRLIASAMGNEDFTVDQLLEPETNIDMAAWYLASLIERFDGRLPLAIASYNGGPHNVRRWMHQYSAQMPLDAFLERIEFEQTHRYVRRVLTHYEAYRAHRGLPPSHLEVTLPELGPDTVAF